MVSIEATDREVGGTTVGRTQPDGSAPGRPSFSTTPRRRALPGLILLAVFLVSFGVRLLAHDVVITADEDNWMRRAGGFTFGLMNGQLGRTYQTGRPGVTTMWLAMLTL